MGSPSAQDMDQEMRPSTAGNPALERFGVYADGEAPPHHATMADGSVRPYASPCGQDAAHSHSRSCWSTAPSAVSPYAVLVRPPSRSSVKNASRRNRSGLKNV